MVHDFHIFLFCHCTYVTIFRSSELFLQGNLKLKFIVVISFTVSLYFQKSVDWVTIYSAKYRKCWSIKQLDYDLKISIRSHRN